MNNDSEKNKVKTFFSKDLATAQDAAGRDALKVLGPISEAEVNYYRNLK